MGRGEDRRGFGERIAGQKARVRGGGFLGEKAGFVKIQLATAQTGCRPGCDKAQVREPVLRPNRAKAC